jgi:hypothetical protein
MPSAAKPAILCVRASHCRVLGIRTTRSARRATHESGETILRAVSCNFVAADHIHRLQSQLKLGEHVELQYRPSTLKYAFCCTQTQIHLVGRKLRGSSQTATAARFGELAAASKGYDRRYVDRMTGGTNLGNPHERPSRTARACTWRIADPLLAESLSPRGHAVRPVCATCFV